MRSEATDLNTTRPAVCETHGEFEQRVVSLFNREIKAPCPECSREKAEKEQAEQEERDAVYRRLEVARKLGDSMIPKRFAAKSLDDYKATTPGQKKALTVCTAYADEFDDHLKAGRCLLMFGKPGTGKTHLATAIANRINSRTNWSAVYRTVGGILQSLKSSYAPGAERTEAQVMDAMISPDLLVIDEVGATKPTEFEQATLFHVINSRYEQMRPTIVVSNLDPSDLPSVLGDRCVDRLREGGGIALVFDWDSARKQVMP